MVHCPVTHHGVIDGIPYNANGGDHARMGVLNAHHIGQEKQIEKVLEIKDHITCGGKCTKSHLFQHTHRGCLESLMFVVHWVSLSFFSGKTSIACLAARSNSTMEKIGDLVENIP